MDIKKLLQLKLRGTSNRKIGELLGISRNTVNGYVKLVNQIDLPNSELVKLDYHELNKKVESLRNFHTVEKGDKYQRLMKNIDIYLNKLKKVGATYQIIWDEYINANPDGYGYTRFKYYLKTIQKNKEYSMPMEHKYGDKLFIDFTGKKLQIIVDKTTGEVKEVEVFIGILGGSQYTYVEACYSQKQEEFMSCTINCLEYFGGVPQALVPDNLKSAVIKANRYEATINQLYKSMSLHYNTVIYPTRSVKPRDKALVEGAVKLVYQRIFYQLSNMTFFSLAELNEQIKIMLETYNSRPFYKQKESRKDRFFKHEKEALNDLPAFRFEPKEIKRAKVQKNCHVYLNGNYYSVPHTYVGKMVRIHFNNKSVEVYFDYQRIGIHKHCFGRNKYSTIKDHMPSHHKFVMDWSPQRFIRWGTRIGEYTGVYLRNILQKSKYPEQSYKSCLGVLSLAKKYTNERLEQACGRALLFEKYSYKTVARILELNLDKLTEEENEITTQQLKLPLHENIRGANYYE